MTYYYKNNIVIILARFDINLNKKKKKIIFLIVALPHEIHILFLPGIGTNQFSANVQRINYKRLISLALENHDQTELKIKKSREKFHVCVVPTRSR